MVRAGEKLSPEELAAEEAIVANSGTSEASNDVLVDRFWDPDFIATELDAPDTPEIAEQQHSLYNIARAQFREFNTPYQLWKGANVGRFVHYAEAEEGFSLNARLEEAEKEGTLTKEDREFFADVTTNSEFNYAFEVLEDHKQDKKILNETSFSKNLAVGLVTGISDPINWIPISRAVKFGSTAVRAAIEGAIIGGANASVRALVNSDMDAADVTRDVVASGLTTALLVKAAPVVAEISKEIWSESGIGTKIKNGFADVLDNVDRYFELEDGILKQVSVGKWGETKQKAKRWVWEVVNNAPLMQMYNSGDETLRGLAPKLMRNRVMNLKGDEVTGISVEEAINLAYTKEGLKNERINKHLKKYIESGAGTREDFEKAVAQARMTTYIDPETGEYFLGKLPSTFEKQEISSDFYLHEEEHIENMTLTRKLEKFIPIEDSNVRAAVKEEIDFWRDIIVDAKESVVLEEEFGEGGIRSTRNALTTEMANMSPEEMASIKSTTNVVALGHIIRRYNRYSIYADMSNFRALLYREVYMNNNKLEPKQINDVIDKIVSKVTDKNIDVRKEMLADLPFSTKFTKDREISLTDEILSTSNYLDFNQVGNDMGAWRSLVAETGLNRVAKETGFHSWSELLRHYKELAEGKIGKITTESAEQYKGISDKKVLEKVDVVGEANKEVYQYNLRLLEDVADLLRGNFGKDGPFSNSTVMSYIKNMKMVQYLSRSGQMLFSMIPDLSAFALKAGFSKKVPQALDFTLKRIFAKRDPQELRQALGFVDHMIQKSRYLDMGYTRGEGGHYIEKAVDLQDTISGVKLFNQVLKEGVVDIHWSDLIEECLKGAGANRDFLNKNGITKEWQKDIQEAFKIYGYKQGEIHVLPFSRIEKRKLTDTLRCVLQSIADQTIQTPGVGDVPRFLRSGLGNFFFMFKYFSFAYFNNVVRPTFGGQASENHVVPWIMSAVGLSILRKYIKDAVNGDESKPDTFNFWKEVADYSSIGGHIVDALSTVIDIFTSRQGAVSRLSSTVGFFDDLVDIMKGIVVQDKKFPWKKARNMTPILNTPIPRMLTNPLLPAKGGSSRSRRIK